MLFLVLLGLSVLLCGQVSADETVYSMYDYNNFECAGKYFPTWYEHPPYRIPKLNVACPEVGNVCNCALNTLDGRFDREEVTDINKDGFITGPEVLHIFVKADKDYDGCVSPAEGAAFDVQVYGYSPLIISTLLSFIGRSNANCTGQTLQNYLHTPRATPDQFRSIVIGGFIQFCESNLKLYDMNCDCAELPYTCLHSRYSEFPACKNYTQTIKGRKGCIFNPPDLSGVF